LNEQAWGERLATILFGFGVVTLIVGLAVLPNPRNIGLTVLCLSLALIEFVAFYSLRRQRKT
jgi:hypothetical protein